MNDIDKAKITTLEARVGSLESRVGLIQAASSGKPANYPQPAVRHASVEDMLRYSQNMVNLYGEWRMFGSHFIAKAHPTAMQYLDDTVKGLKEVMDDLITAANAQLSEEKPDA